MVASKHGHWEASQKASAPKLPGLEPFVFDPGEVQSQEELVREAQSKVRHDKALRKVLRSRKGEITQILQDCLDKVHEQLEKGEELCTKAHFPLLNAIDFTDLESIAHHDFRKDLHADNVDKILKDMLYDFLEIVWNNVTVENTSKARSLERFNNALQARMETLEYHLSDRARQLCNCRFAYFQEITHLRNQVYRKGIEGDEKFEPEEVYYFDPSEYLEEDLREQLNDKIDMSVKGYHFKLMEARRRIEDLEMELETAGGAFRFKKEKEDKLKDAVEKMLVRYKPTQVFNELNKQVPREVTGWAMHWAENNGYVKDTHVSGLQAQLDEAKENARKLEEEMRKLRDQFQEELEEERSRVRGLTDELESVKGDVAFDVASRRSSMTNGVDLQEMESLRTQIARMKLELEQAATKVAEATAEAERLAAENAEMRHRVQQVEGENQKALHSLSQVDLPQQSLTGSQGKVSGRSLEVKEVNPAGYESAKAMLQDMHHNYLEMRHGRTPSFMGQLGSIAGVGVADLQSSQRDVDPKYLADFEAIMQDVSLDDNLVEMVPEGSGQLLDYVKWSKALLQKKDQLLNGLERRLMQTHAEMSEQTELLTSERRRSALFESEANTMADQLSRSKSEMESMKTLLNANAFTKPGKADKKRVESFGHRIASAGGGFECETQTMIAGNGDGGFYILEYPPTEAQEAIEAELHDLNACALGNWEATIEQIRSCLRPPLGYGTGFCPRSAFIRLFQGTWQRVARMDELIEMAENLKKSELLRMVQGVHLLMESALPNEDVALRETIFGKGITEAALYGTRNGFESAALSKKWCGNAKKIVGILLQKYEDIELGLHIGRRTFMVGGGAGNNNRVAGGAAGGGLAARERKDFSPPRVQIYPGLLEQQNDIWELQELRSENLRSPRRKSPDNKLDCDLSLEGHEIPMYNVDGNSYTMTGFDAANGPYIVVAGRLVPRGGVEMLPQHGYIRPASRPQSPQIESDVSGNARSGRPEVNEVPHIGHIHRSCSPPSKSRKTSPSRAGSPSRVSPMRARSPSPEDASRIRVQVTSHAHPVNNTLASSKYESQQSIPSMTHTRTTAASTGELNFVPTGALLPHSRSGCHSPVEEPAAEDEVTANEAAQKLMARLRPARGKLALTQGWQQIDPFGDIEEPQEEPAPQFATISRPQSGFVGRGLRHQDIQDRREREVERVRRQICEGAAGLIGPTPIWALEDLAEKRRPRTAGGRHTAAEPRLLEKARVQMVRSASAGRLRGSMSAAQGFSVNGNPANATALKSHLSRPGTAPGSRSLGVSSKKLSSSGPIGVMGGSIDTSAKPAVRITALPLGTTDSEHPS